MSGIKEMRLRFGASTLRQERQKINFMTNGTLRRARGSLMYLLSDVIQDNAVRVAVQRAKNFLDDAIHEEAASYQLAVEDFRKEKDA